MISDTLNIFRYLYTTLPPSVPDDVRADMKTALEQLENNPNLTIDDLEATMISFGKKIWAYRKAFHELKAVYEGKMGETLLLHNLPKSMQKKYNTCVIDQGGTYRDCAVGRTAMDQFDPEERTILSETLIMIRNVVDQHTRQAALTTDKALYQKKIEEFRGVQQEIESIMAHLHELADAEQEHPELASEIRAHVRGFEYGLAALGPQSDLTSARRSIDLFAGRKAQKNARLQG